MQENHTCFQRRHWLTSLGAYGRLAIHYLIAASLKFSHVSAAHYMAVNILGAAKFCCEKFPFPEAQE